MPALVVGGMALATFLLLLVNLAEALPPSQWSTAWHPGAGMDAIVFRDAVLPRIVTAVLAGALLGAAGAVFQQVLRNPLATPDTLGASSGGDLALSFVTLFEPNLLQGDRTLIALAGGLGAMGLVLGLASRSRFAAGPTLLIGLAVMLCLNAVTAMLVVLRAHDLSGLLVWMGGSLAVQSWQPVGRLAGLGLPLLGLLLLLIRPLSLLSAEQGAARGLGAHVPLLRFGCLALSVGLAAVVAGEFGTIGFVGLLAPTVARLAGARRFGSVLGASLATGALVLSITDGGATLASRPLGTDLPTGALTALVGTPILVALALRRRTTAMADGLSGPVGLTRHAGPVAAALLLTLGLLLPLTLLVGRDATGWSIAWFGPALEPVLQWRLPRIVGAAGAGALLAVSGTVLQRLSGNPLASPEMLGLGAGAGAGLLLASLADASPVVRGFAAVAGALATAGLLIGWSMRSRVELGRILVVGLALTTLVGAFVGVLVAVGDPHATSVLAWIAGSTYRVTGTEAATACGLCVPALLLLALAARWLDLMPLGADTRLSLGLPERRAQACLILLATSTAACATLIVGPISFVGLVVPQLATVAGLRRAFGQGLCAALGGALLMVAADAIGRTVAFPWQVPTGLVATLLGSPILLATLIGRRRS